MLLTAWRMCYGCSDVECGGWVRFQSPAWKELLSKWVRDHRPKDHKTPLAAMIASRRCCASCGWCWAGGLSCCQSVSLRVCSCRVLFFAPCRALTVCCCAERRACDYGTATPRYLAHTPCLHPNQPCRSHLLNRKAYRHLLFDDHHQQHCHHHQSPTTTAFAADHDLSHHHHYRHHLDPDDTRRKARAAPGLTLWYPPAAGRARALKRPLLHARRRCGIL